MSEFKIFGGIYEDEKGIIDGETIESVSLRGERVHIKTKYGHSYSFQTDLETIEQVLLCLEAERGSLFTMESLIHCLQDIELENNTTLPQQVLEGFKVKRVEDTIIPIGEGE